jgi:non-homologous end joining protein Ku
VADAVESKSEIWFRQIHKPTGRRVNNQKVVPGVGVVENADIVKGYEVDKDRSRPLKTGCHSLRLLRMLSCRLDPA